MDSLVKINNQEIAVKTYGGQRVVTFKDIDMCHERPEGTARKRFNDNKKRFIEGTDFFKISASEIRTRKLMDISAKTTEDVTLITHTGYMMLVKSFTDDLAWAVQRDLVNKYFQVPKETLPATYIDALKALVASEEQKQLLSHERDQLQIELDHNMEWYTVKRVANMNGVDWKTFDWRRLKSASAEMGIEVKKVFDANYTQVNSYHQSIWEQVYPEYEL